MFPSKVAPRFSLILTTVVQSYPHLARSHQNPRYHTCCTPIRQSPYHGKRYCRPTLPPLCQHKTKHLLAQSQRLRNLNHRENRQVYDIESHPRVDVHTPSFPDEVLCALLILHISSPPRGHGNGTTQQPTSKPSVPEAVNLRHNLHNPNLQRFKGAIIKLRPQKNVLYRLLSLRYKAKTNTPFMYKCSGERYG